MLCYVMSMVWYSIIRSVINSRLKTFLFCKSVPPQPSFSSSELTTWVHWTVTSEHIRFSLFSFFSVFHFLVVVSVW